MLLPERRPAIARLGQLGAFEEQAQAGVSPQVSVCTPCVRVGGGQWCFSLPIIGRRCLNVPNLGTWKACCSTRWGWPPVSCGLQRC
jgi:hypothetical protein